MKNKGITLIALVITIIIMLILVAVTVNYSIKSGLLKKAQDGGLSYTQKEIEERIAAIRLEYRVDQETGKLDEDKDLEEYIKENLGEDVIEDVTITEESLNLEKIEEKIEDYKAENQEQTENVGIILEGESTENIKITYKNGEVYNIKSGEDEKTVSINMDNWIYTLKADGSFVLGLDDGSTQTPSYIGPINDGKIEGEIPQYIATEETDWKLKPVTELNNTFIFITDLKIAPEIPTTVTDLVYTFYECTNLTTMSKIPQSVKRLHGTFDGCISLTGNLVIECSELNYYNSPFSSVSTKEGCNLILKIKNSSIVDTIVRDISNNKNISVEFPKGYEQE